MGSQWHGTTSSRLERKSWLGSAVARRLWGQTDNPVQKFTGKERDSETLSSADPDGLDYFGARYFSAAQGRFTSPDWSDAPQTVPYADLADPQTLNLYAYVRNNPLARTDPTGHCPPCLLAEGAQLLESPPVQEVIEKLSVEAPHWIAGAGVLLSAVVSGNARPPAYVPGGSLTDSNGNSIFSSSANRGGQTQQMSQGNQSTPADPNEPKRKQGGATTEPKLPSKVVVQEDGVTIVHNTRSGDHGPAHLHVSGNGPDTRIGQMGKPGDRSDRSRTVRCPADGHRQQPRRDSQGC